MQLGASWLITDPEDGARCASRHYYYFDHYDGSDGETLGFRFAR